MGLLTENNPNIANIGWNEAFGDPQEFSIVSPNLCEVIFGVEYNDFNVIVPHVKSLSNSLISMLPQPADRFINLIYRYHNYRDSLPDLEKRNLINEFLRYFSPCNGGFTFDANMTKYVNNIYLDMKTLQGINIKIGINNLMFIQVSGSSDLRMVFRINISYCKDPIMNMYSSWSSFMNIFYKFSL